MKKFFILIGVLIIGGVAWYLGSPLFIDNVVDEELPFAVESSSSSSREPTFYETLSPEEQDLMDKMDDLTAEEVEAMPEEEQTALQDDMNKLAEKMPDTVVEDSMPDDAAGEQSAEQPGPDPDAGEDQVIEEEPAGPTVVAQGTFVGADDFHKGSGTATVYQLESEVVLRFSDFSVTNGPALSVFLTKADGSMTDIGKLKGNKGNQNYPIPSSIDVTEYTGVLIYCVPFKVPFASASLQ